MTASALSPPITGSGVDELVDGQTGLVTWASDVRVERTDPDVFVVATQTAELTTYGLASQAKVEGSGAGLDRRTALGAAVGEVAERYACAVEDPAEVRVGSYDDLELGTARPIPPEQWALYRDHQLRGTWYSRFDRQTRLGWVLADSLTRHRECLVPASLVFMPYQRVSAESGEELVAEAVSTGTACAPDASTALLRGLCEVVERDAFVIVWRNRLPCPRVHIDEASGLLGTFKDHFAKPWLEYRLWHTTLDLGVPSFFGLVRDHRRRPAGTVVGGAAHVDPVQGVLKTLLELAQGLQWMAHTPLIPIEHRPGFDNIRSFNDRMHLYASGSMDHAFDFLDADQTERALSEIPAAAGSEGAPLDVCCALLEERGLEVVARDLTTIDLEDCGLHVVKVLVPGCQPLEGDHRMPFTGGRRWVEVPSLLGRRPASGEAVLNPDPHPYP